VIAIIAILAVVVVLTLNPAELLRQSRDANRVSDMATLTSALNLYLTDQGGGSGFSLGNASNTGISVPDPNNSSTCGSLGLPSLNTSTGQQWYCGSSSSSRNINSQGWIPVNLSSISAGSPIGSLPVDPTNQTSSGLFYAYNTNGTQFEVTANLESQKYKTQYGNTPQTSLFPEVISGGTPTVSALYNPSGLVGYWPLNEGSGSSTIDASGNGNAGAWSGTPAGNNNTYYTGGKVGTYAGNFDGSTNYIDMGSSAALASSNFTISAWVSAVNFPGTPYIVSKITGNYGYSLQSKSNGLPRLLIGNGSTNPGISGGTKPLTTWTFVVATYTSVPSVSGNLYMNGIDIASATSMGVINYSGVPDLTIGGISGSSQWAGSIDEVRIYNRALSAAEIMALYNAEK